MRAALVLALLTTACASVDRAPPPRVADAALPTAFAALDPGEGQSQTLASLLPADDSAYAKLAAAALAGSPTLESALARIDAARAQLRGAAAARAPSIDASTTVTRQRNTAAQFGVPAGAAFDRSRTAAESGLDLSWDVDLFGRLRAGSRAAAARLDAATADAAGVRLALRTDVARAVSDLRAVEARLGLARDDAARAGDLARLTRDRAEAGIAPRADVVRAEALAALAASRIEPIRAERAALIGSLVTLTAQPAQAVELAFASPAPAATAAPLPPLAVPSVLLRARPDVAAAERRLAAADAEIAAAAAERFPRLTITGAIGLFSLGFGSLFDEDALIGSLGAGLAGPLTDFGRVGARIAERQADARAAFAAYRGALFTALGETEAALGAVAAADRQVERLAAQVALDADAATLTRDRHARGLETFLAVLDAERTALASRSALIEARADAARRRIALYAALGGAGGA